MPKDILDLICCTLNITCEFFSDDFAMIYSEEKNGTSVLVIIQYNLSVWFVAICKLIKYINALVNQFRIRGRGRARGGFAGTNTGPSNSNTTFQKRPKEEEWDPEYTPKSKKYFLVGAREFIILCMHFSSQSIFDIRF